MKIKAFVSTKYIGSKVEDEIEIPDDELEDLSPEEREKAIQETVMEWMYQNIDWGWSE